MSIGGIQFGVQRLHYINKKDLDINFPPLGDKHTGTTPPKLIQSEKDTLNEIKSRECNNIRVERERYQIIREGALRGYGNNIYRDRQTRVANKPPVSFISVENRDRRASSGLGEWPGNHPIKYRVVNKQEGKIKGKELHKPKFSAGLDLLKI